MSMCEFRRAPVLFMYAFLVIVLMVYSPDQAVGLGKKLVVRVRGKQEVRKDMTQGAQL